MADSDASEVIPDEFEWEDGAHDALVGVGLDAAAAFLRRQIQFCRDVVSGNLSPRVWIDPDFRARCPELSAAILSWAGDDYPKLPGLSVRVRMSPGSFWGTAEFKVGIVHMGRGWVRTFRLGLTGSRPGCIEELDRMSLELIREIRQGGGQARPASRRTNVLMGFVAES